VCEYTTFRWTASGVVAESPFGENKLPADSDLSGATIDELLQMVVVQSAAEAEEKPAA
jgi:hypothetical protein